MKKIKNAVILAAGGSTRFGENKLLRKIEGKTLPQHAVEFCIENEIENIYVTINKTDIYFNGCGKNPISHPIMDDLEVYKLYNKIEYRFQDENKYGPAAAILPHLNDDSDLSDDFIVLFGDNFYKGKLPEFERYLSTCIASYLIKPPDYRNLRFAFIKKGILIEKPHTEVDGKFFCGYAVFDYKDAKAKINEIELSGRSEYEITSFINSMENTGFVENELIWGELTYQGDEANIIKLIGEKK